MLWETLQKSACIKPVLVKNRNKRSLNLKTEIPKDKPFSAFEDPSPTDNRINTPSSCECDNGDSSSVRPMKTNKQIGQFQPYENHRVHSSTDRTHGLCNSVASFLVEQASYVSSGTLAAIMICWDVDLTQLVYGRDSVWLLGF